MLDSAEDSYLDDAMTLLLYASYHHMTDMLKQAHTLSIVTTI